MNFRGILLPELVCKIIFEWLFLGLKVWTDSSLFTGPYIIILCLVYTSTLEHISDSSCHFYMALKPFTRKWPESFGLLGHTSKWAVREYICTLVVVVVSCIVPMGKFFQVPGQEFCTMKSKKHQYSKKLLVLIFSSYFGILMLSME